MSQSSGVSALRSEITCFVCLPRSVEDTRAPLTPVSDRKVGDGTYGWPLGKWQFQDTFRPPPGQGVKRAADVMLEPVVPDDPTINNKAKVIIKKLVAGALESEEDTGPLNA